ncbi:MAG: VWA domain-containing protein, partial [Polaribacter sp.]
MGLFLLLLLFINPKINKTSVENIKPIVSILVDDSKSIPYFKEENTVKNILKEISENSALQEKFNIQLFEFGKELQVLDSLKFKSNETNISQAISSVNELNKLKNSPIVLLTDGNQTIGNDYEFSNSKQPIYSVVVGDTTKYKDLKINQLNVNRYSYIKNKFPVEVLLKYDGNEDVNTRFSIYNKGKIVYSKKVVFSKTKNSKTIRTNLSSTKEGINYYTASIQKIKGEKNTNNNTKTFSVEVINEQTKTLLLTAVLHPDIGALKKAIESNKQRSVDVFLVDKFKKQLNDYQLIIFYQPNNKFQSIFDKVEKEKRNYFLISGSQTDWNFINKNNLGFFKKGINQTENYGAVYNPSFIPFLQKDFGFHQFPPLKDKFGEVTFSRDHQDLLFENINGVPTKQPLLSVLEQNNQ